MTYNKDRNKNILLVVAFVCATFLVMIFRIYQLAIMKTSNGVDLASYHSEDFNRSSIASARRGSIYDINGYPIAMDTTSYSLYAVLQGGDGVEVIDDVDHVAKVLSQYIDLTRDQILERLLTPDAYQIEFGQAGQDLSQDTKEAIEAEHLAGIKFQEKSKRVYLNDYFAAHLIGYSSVNEELSQDLPVEIQTGQMGIEAMLDEELSGIKNFRQLIKQDPKLDYLNGEDVYLTLDSRLQNYLDDLMNQAYQTYKPEQMMAYLVETKTGKLIASSQRPTFNLNTREGIDQEWKNVLVEEAVEPGSTIKILTLATAKNMGLYQDGERFKSGSVQVYDQIVKDYNGYGWGDITYDEGLIHSSNVAMVKLVEKMGIDQWEEALNRFGFGKTTQSGLPNEVQGNVAFDNPVNAIMSGFGQGGSATPLQLLQAFTAVANQGKMLKIQFIDGIGSRGNTYKLQELGQVFSPETARHVLNVMVQTVEHPEGTAKPFKNNQVTIAAKTGTAQIADPDGVGYLTGPNDYYFSVVAFFPAEDPQYMLYMAIKRPTDDHQKMGSQILAEIFNPFVDNIMLTN